MDNSSHALSEREANTTIAGLPTIENMESSVWSETEYDTAAQIQIATNSELLDQSDSSSSYSREDKSVSYNHNRVLSHHGSQRSRRHKPTHQEEDRFE